jgi:hypothetical protein
MLPSFLLSTALLVGLACVSANPSAQAQESGSGLKVTVMIYSGRPNPTFTVTDAAVIARLSDAYRGASPLEGFDEETVVPSILGYQGVRIENPRGEGSLPRLILAYRGNLEIRNGGVRFLSDPGLEIENTVIEQAVELDLMDDLAVRMIRQGSGNAQEP